MALCLSPAALLGTGLNRFLPFLVIDLMCSIIDVVRAENRDGLKHFLAADGIQTEIYYPVPLHIQRCFEETG